MSDLMMSSNGNQREYDNHPEGTFMAVCRDIWIERKPNPKYPGTTIYGKPEPEQTVKVCIDFLTDEPIEIGGNMVPRFIRYKASPSWHDDSNLRKFIRGWNPALGKADKADLEALVGTGAYLTIAHSAGKDGKVWANVVGVAAPPKGATIPLVPKDFVRAKFKDGTATAPAPQKAAPSAPVAEEPNDLPW
jgi:hypothetical protein